MTKPVLELEARALADATAMPPLLHELGPEGARKVLDDLQAAPIDKPDVEEKWITVAADVGDVRVWVKPVGSPGASGCPPRRASLSGTRLRSHRARSGRGGPAPRGRPTADGVRDALTRRARGGGAGH